MPSYLFNRDAVHSISAVRIDVAAVAYTGIDSPIHGRGPLHGSQCTAVILLAGPLENPSES